MSADLNVQMTTRKDGNHVDRLGRTLTFIQDMSAFIGTSFHDALPLVGQYFLSQLATEANVIYAQHLKDHIEPTFAVMAQLQSCSAGLVDRVARHTAFFDTYITRSVYVFEINHPESDGIIPRTFLDRLVFLLYLCAVVVLCTKAVWYSIKLVLNAMGSAVSIGIKTVFKSRTRKIRHSPS
eukprot:gnl/MRDRNA2_/MRDRNA2_67043_c0_seq1.p1 gnl/MRDRNA2_/MRDRNA2_67043_c0~~gnl/MRDRNA2_/MRDRNA2_67043_c0_seq1.p1  ORF type:complete len:181 (-),score=10.33 gnl/MRDRNA2_/MRDRNA2_67043_c0_seq1:17-559(-)